jgi:hypothetical protein
MLYPVVEFDETPSVSSDPGTKIGLGLQGADPLQEWAYGAEAYVQNGRLWGELTVETGQFFLRPQIGLYTQPIPAYAPAVGGFKTTTMLDRGISLSVKAPVILESNVFATYVDFNLETRLRQTRLLEPSEVTAATSNRLTLSPDVLFAYRIQANPRDVIPNHGLLVHASAEVDAWTQAAHAGRAMASRAYVYLPFLKALNHGIRIDGGLLTRNEAAVYDYTFFKPRGYEDTYLPGGSYLRYGIEYLLPLRYVDNGAVLLPVYLGSVFAYTFAESLQQIGGTSLGITRLTSLGAGLGFHVRLFFHFNAEIRVGASYRLPEQDLVFISR